MRMIDVKFEPPKVKVTQQEIMDDLHYPHQYCISSATPPGMQGDLTGVVVTLGG